MRDRIPRLALALLLTVAPATAIACDKEDRRDAEETGNDIEEGVDNLDSDGKDD